MTGSGLCSVAWEWKDNTVCMDIPVPFGCVMRLQLPDGGDVQRLESGDCHFDVLMPAINPSGLETPWRELLENEATREAVARVFPTAIRGIAFQYEMYTMEQLMQSPFSELTREDIKRLETEMIQAQIAWSICDGGLSG